MPLKQSSLEQLGSLILGSKSATRRLILEELGVPFTVLGADIDEKAIRAAEPRRLVLALAHAKASAVLGRLSAAGGTGGPATGKKCLVLCGDAVVVHKGRTLEKPRSAAEARGFLHSYADAPATTVAAVVVVDAASGRRFEGVSEAEVYFYPLPEDVVARLCEDGAVLESAGGLRVEHPLVGRFVEAMHGSQSAVMGFDKELVSRLIEEALSA